MQKFPIKKVYSLQHFSTIFELFRFLAIHSTRERIFRVRVRCEHWRWSRAFFTFILKFIIEIRLFMKIRRRDSCPPLDYLENLMPDMRHTSQSLCEIGVKRKTKFALCAADPNSHRQIGSVACEPHKIALDSSRQASWWKRVRDPVLVLTPFASQRQSDVSGRTLAVEDWTRASYFLGILMAWAAAVVRAWVWARELQAAWEGDDRGLDLIQWQGIRQDRVF